MEAEKIAARKLDLEAQLKELREALIALEAETERVRANINAHIGAIANCDYFLDSGENVIGIAGSAGDPD